MSLETLLIFIPACFLLNISPGPNNLLTMSNASRFGFSRAMTGGLGRLGAFSLMIALTATGLGVVLSTSELAFLLIKWLGAAYLVYLGVKIWRTPVSPPTPEQAFAQTQASLFALARQEFCLAMGNPKAILIFTAFFPQFMSPSAPPGPQFATMGATFLVMEFAVVALYASVGRQFGVLCQSVRAKRLFNRFSGGFLVSAGALLATVRNSATVAV